MIDDTHVDVIIIGSGLAGLMVAEILSAHKNVMVITKSSMEHSNSMLAQGGIAAAVERDDKWQDHFFDTIVAGGFHNVEEVTRKLVKKGPELIEKLIDLGVSFDRDEHGELALGREGAHGRRRILHAGGDATGKALVQCLLERVRKNVMIHEYEMAMDVILDEAGQCIGVWTKRNDGERHDYYANHTVIATGGCGRLYPVTSNDKSVTGDGLAIAYRAGAELADVEFIQFHPTMLVKDGTAMGLISEAVRGEGAKLVTESGRLLMDGVHELKDLAPRDIVAREIHKAIERDERVYLDMSNIKDFSTHFPSITEICRSAQVDLAKGRIPVAPGAHFMMGGIQTDEFGQTSIKHLYAIGEVAHTGVHGANRLASNSLLEAVVFANEVAQTILRKPKQIVHKKKVKTNKVQLRSLPSKEEIQHRMMSDVGIVRNHEGLIKANNWLSSYEEVIQNNQSFDLDIAEKTICNMLTVAKLITISALLRTESRGGHYRSDYREANQDHWYQKQIIRSIHGTKFTTATTEQLLCKEGIV